jgi:hypothetical protein
MVQGMRQTAHAMAILRHQRPWQPTRESCEDADNQELRRKVAGSSLLVVKRHLGTYL